MRQTENRVVSSMRAGFTLMEILVAVAIIGILGTVAVQSITGNIEKAKRTAAEDSVRNIENAISLYYTDVKRFPSSLNDLVVYRGDEDPYIKGGEGALEDPWGNEYRMEKKGRGYVVISNGPDGEQGTEDDIRSDEIKKSKK